MLHYSIIGHMAVFDTREPVAPVSGELCIGVPGRAIVYVNGQEVTPCNGCIRLSVVDLKAVNTVRIRNARGSRRAEGFLWDGAVVTPEGYEPMTLLAELAAVHARETEELEIRLDELESEVAKLKRSVETPLFL